MKRFAITITLLYGAIILVLTLPVILAAFYPEILPKDAIQTFTQWIYWVLLAIMIACQAALLGIPVRVESRRPVTKKPVIFLIVASALLAAAMILGIAAAIGEALSKQPDLPSGLNSLMLGMQTNNVFLKETVVRSAIAGFLLMWLIWGLIFFRWSKKLEPRTFVERQCRLLFAGSVLELLVAVPTHILARSRDYCCAGFSTFIGIALGISVMLLSFGPGVFFLYLERWKKLHPGLIK